MSDIDNNMDTDFNDYVKQIDNTKISNMCAKFILSIITLIISAIGTQEAINTGSTPIVLAVNIISLVSTALGIFCTILYIIAYGIYISSRFNNKASKVILYSLMVIEMIIEGINGISYNVRAVNPRTKVTQNNIIENNNV
jgi:hypothetical protein